MLFSAQYTQYTIIPRAARTGKAQEFDLNLVLTTSMMTDRYIGAQAYAGRILSEALNAYAGGRRMFKHSPVHVTWSLSWDYPGHRHPNVLGVWLVKRKTLTVDKEGGVFYLTPDRGTYADQMIGSVFLAAEDLFLTKSRPHGTAADLFRRTAAHEFGHAETLLDDHGDIHSIMYYRQLTSAQRRSIHQRWTDDELRGALQNLFQPNNLPPWLHS